MAAKFPKGFHDAADPLSGDYLLNAVYAWGLDHPQDAPTVPTANPGLNLLHESVAYMLGVDIDYYVEVNMAGFASIIDAVGGVTVDVGPDAAADRRRAARRPPRQAQRLRTRRACSTWAATRPSGSPAPAATPTTTTAWAANAASCRACCSRRAPPT